MTDEFRIGSFEIEQARFKNEQIVRSKRKVNGWTLASFGIHTEQFERKPKSHVTIFAITHLQTGRALCWAKSFVSSKEIVCYLLALEIDWENFAQLDHQEKVRISDVFHAQHKPIFKKNGWLHPDHKAILESRLPVARLEKSR